MKEERLKQRKRDKAVAARYCSLSSMDFESILPDSAEEETLESSECESSSSTLKFIQWRSPGHHQLLGTRMWTSQPENVPRRTPHGGDEDEVGRGTDKGVTWGTILIWVTGMSVTMTRMMGAGLPQTRVMLGLVLHPRVELPQSRSILLGPSAVRTSLPQTLVRLGLVPPGAGLSQNRLTILMVLILLTEGSYWEIHATVDNILSAGSYENQTQGDWTLSSDGTPAMRTRPTASHEFCLAGPSPLGELRPGYHRQTVECRVLREFDFHSCTCWPAGGDGSARWPSWAGTWLLPGFEGSDTMSAVSSENQTDVC